MWSAIHTGDMDAKLEEAKRTLGLAKQYMDKLTKEADYMAKDELSNAQVKEIIELLLPFPDEAGDKAKQNIELLRNELIARYILSPDIKKFYGTQWGFINAVSDFATHREPIRKAATFQENLFEKTINGHPLIDQAYDLLKAA
jgi:hypothetical protein